MTTTDTTRDRGDGRLYREKGSRFWWMALYLNGKEVRQSTKETDEKKARRVLKRHVAAAVHGDLVPHEGQVTLTDLLTMVEVDYQVHQRRSVSTLRYPPGTCGTSSGRRPRRSRSPATGSISTS